VGLLFIPGPTHLIRTDREWSHTFSGNGGPVVKFRVGNRLAVAFVLGILVLSAVAFLFAGAPSGTHPAAPASASGGLRSDASLGHGDLTVTSGQTVVLSPGTTGSSVYYEAGNISVQAGGTLIVDKLTIDWVQFIGVTGTVAQRLSNVFWFDDAGTVTLSQSTITTDPYVLNAFVKLNVSVTGKMVLSSHSAFAFPGWVTVGTGGSLFMNDSLSTNNTQVGSQTLAPAVLVDEEYSPALQATAGGQIFIGDSVVNNYYADDYAANGVPGPVLIGNNVTQAPDYKWAGFNLGPPVAQGIAQAYAWENTPLLSGAIQVGYVSSSTYTSSSGNTFTYDGTGYSLNSVTFPSAAAGAVLAVPLGANALNAIETAGGIPTFLQNSGQFGTASAESVSFGFSVASVNVTSLSIVLYPDFQYNMTATGAGAQITAVDSQVGINFNPIPGTPVVQGTPPDNPWASNKLLVSGGANAYLGNITVSGAPFAPFNDSSAVIPSGSGAAYLYQWLEVPITGGLNKVPVANGSTAAAYAGSNPALGTTVAGLNDLGTTDPLLASYVSQALAARGMDPSVSGGSGIAWSMLLSTIVNASLLPTGQFVGTYNVTVTVPPGQAGEVTNVAASLTPYPQVVSPGAPFMSPSASFPGYEAVLGIASSTSLVASVHNSTVAIGQDLVVEVNVKNTGTAPTHNYTVQLYYPASTGPVLVGTSGLITAPLSAGANTTVSVHWVVNETVTGRTGKLADMVSFVVTASWNGGIPDGGTNSTLLPITVTPALFAVTYTPPTGKLPVNGDTIDSSGVVDYAGKGAATLYVYARGSGGASYLLLDESVFNNTTFETDLTAISGMAQGTSYTLELVVTYNGRTYSNDYGTLTTTGTAASPNILLMKILFFDLWIWLAIAAAVIAGVVGFLMLSGRFARGRLVECGECGNLIPEDATVCPKCGAEFESDLVRCSRCGSTIPSSSAVCPECAATLLARAGPENSDPERQSYADFVERFRNDAKKELGANYSEGAFWDWWKRQPSYVSFSQWRLQQAQGTRAGMTAPVMTEAAPAPTGPAPPRRPPSGGAGAPPATGGAPAARPAAPRAAPAARMAPAAAAPAAPAPPLSPAPAASVSVAPAAAAPVGMKNCPNCGKQINADFLVCPFCGSVTG
jgi:RNA polymerase subunit RPABC4/transcription elongation factor Spt4